MPREKSSGLQTSTTTLSWNAAAPTDWITPSVASPLVQRKISSLSPVASVKVPCDALTPFFLAHLPAFWLFGVREPIVTWWPNCTSFVPMASPTIPVPRTPIFIIPPSFRFLSVVARHSLSHTTSQWQTDKQDYLALPFAPSG